MIPSVWNEGPIQITEYGASGWNIIIIISEYNKQAGKWGETGDDEKVSATLTSTTHDSKRVKSTRSHIVFGVNTKKQAGTEVSWV